MIAPRVRRVMDRGVERLHILPRRNWKVAGTALALLAFGTVKEWGPISDFVKDPRDWFSEGMMLLVLAGWAVWLAGVAGEFFGTEILSVERGELVISRGIGRLRRTWRYVTRDIAWMVSDGPVTEEQARPVVHHIFHKPDVGAVRFDYGRGTVFLAETLDEESGETIVRWLRTKLPRSASESDHW
jgi:hypothetical protein